MSAFGTKKPGGNLGVQLTFPSVFESAYQKVGQPLRVETEPTSPLPKLSYQIGNDFQSVWHKQKMEDAHRMVRAKVQSTINSDVRAHTAPHNMPNHQKPVLGQRKFANPSMGAQSAYWDRPVPGFSGGSYNESRCAEECDELRGGVLRTSQGQAYGKSLLQARVAQLNAINQASMLFANNQPTPARTEAFTGERTQLGLDTNPAVELASLLQSILDTVTGGLQNRDDQNPDPSRQGVDTSRLTFQDSYRAFQLIVRLASSGTSDDIDNVLEFINGSSAGDGIIPALEELTITPPEYSSSAKSKLMLSMKEFWTRVKKYLEKMIQLTDRPTQERVNASSAYIQALGFKRMMGSVGRRGLPAEFLDPQSAQEAVDVRSGSFGSAPRSDGGGSSLYSDSTGSSSGSSGDSGGLRPPIRTLGRTAFERARSEGVQSGTTDSSEQRYAEESSQLTGHHSRRGRGFVRREDSQHGYSDDGGASFDSDERNRFAYNSGAMDTGGRGVGWAGEEEGVPYGEAPQMVAEELGPVEEEGEAEGGQEEGDARPEFRLSSRRNAFGDWDVAPRLGMSGATGLLATPDSRPPPSAVLSPSPPSSVRAEPPTRAPPTARPEWLSRANLPKDIAGFRAFATRVNQHYGNRLPDGRGPISVGVGKASSVRQNFIRRLGL